MIADIFGLVPTMFVTIFCLLPEPVTAFSITLFNLHLRHQLCLLLKQISATSLEFIICPLTQPIATIPLCI